MISSGTREDFPQLKALWCLVFGDDETLVEKFLEERFASCLCLTDREEGEILSALYLLPAKLCFRGKVRPIWYLYAAATHPKARGQGRMGRLMHAARDWARMRGIYAIALVPSEACLFDFYSRFGYQPFFSVREVVLSPEEWKKCGENAPESAEECSPHRMYCLRHAFIEEHDGVQWEEDMVSFAAEFHEEGGDKCVTVHRDGHEGYALVSLDGNVAQISECIADRESFSSLARMIWDPEISEYRLRLPVDSVLFPGRGEVRFFGMLQPIAEPVDAAGTTAYLGLEMG